MGCATGNTQIAAAPPCLSTAYSKTILQPAAPSPCLWMFMCLVKALLILFPCPLAPCSLLPYPCTLTPDSLPYPCTTLPQFGNFLIISSDLWLNTLVSFMLHTTSSTTSQPSYFGAQQEPWLHVHAHAFLPCDVAFAGARFHHALCRLRRPATPQVCVCTAMENRWPGTGLMSTVVGVPRHGGPQLPC